MPPSPKPRVVISVASFNEIASRLEQQGYKFGENVGEYTVEKGTLLVPDKDFRMVNIRQNAADIATRSYNTNVHGEDFVAYANKVFEFIYNGVQPKADGWK